MNIIWSVVVNDAHESLTGLMHVSYPHSSPSGKTRKCQTEGPASSSLSLLGTRAGRFVFFSLLLLTLLLAFQNCKGPTSEATGNGGGYPGGSPLPNGNYHHFVFDQLCAAETSPTGIPSDRALASIAYSRNSLRFSPPHAIYRRSLCPEPAAAPSAKDPFYSESLWETVSETETIVKPWYQATVLVYQGRIFDRYEPTSTSVDMDQIRYVQILCLSRPTSGAPAEADDFAIAIDEMSRDRLVARVFGGRLNKGTNLPHRYEIPPIDVAVTSQGDLFAYYNGREELALASTSAPTATTDGLEFEATGKIRNDQGLIIERQMNCYQNVR